MTPPLAAVWLRRSATAVALSFLAGCASLRGETAAATPQRPTVSSDTNTTHEGTLELEAGAAIDPGDLFDLPMTLKWGAGPRTELQAGWSPYQIVTLPGEDARGIGDVSVGVRHRFWEEGDVAPAAALQLLTRLPTADESKGLTSGEIDFFPGISLLKAFGPVTATAYYEARILGDPTGSGTELGHTFTLAGSASWDRVGVFAEAAGILSPIARTDVYLAIVGGAFAVTPGFVVDVAAAIGLSEDAPDFTILFGVTSNLGDRPLTGLFGL